MNDRWNPISLVPYLLVIWRIRERGQELSLQSLLLLPALLTLAPAGMLTASAGALQEGSRLRTNSLGRFLLRLESEFCAHRPIPP
jgi:hypothetical protein